MYHLSPGVLTQPAPRTSSEKAVAVQYRRRHPVPEKEPQRRIVRRRCSMSCQGRKGIFVHTGAPGPRACVSIAMSAPRPLMNGTLVRERTREKERPEMLVARPMPRTNAWLKLRRTAASSCILHTCESRELLIHRYSNFKFHHRNPVLIQRVYTSTIS